MCLGSQIAKFVGLWPDLPGRNAAHRVGVGELNGRDRDFGFHQLPHSRIFFIAWQDAINLKFISCVQGDGLSCMYANLDSH